MSETRAGCSPTLTCSGSCFPVQESPACVRDKASRIDDRLTGFWKRNYSESLSGRHVHDFSVRNLYLVSFRRLNVRTHHGPEPKVDSVLEEYPGEPGCDDDQLITLQR